MREREREREEERERETERETEREREREREREKEKERETERDHNIYGELTIQSTCALETIDASKEHCQRDGGNREIVVIGVCASKAEYRSQRQCHILYCRLSHTERRDREDSAAAESIRMLSSGPEFRASWTMCGSLSCRW